MSARKKPGCAMRVAVRLFAFTCVLTLFALFYAAMAYLPPAEDVSGEPASAMRPLCLGEGTLLDERTQQMNVGGVLCTVVTREYRLADGTSALAISASDAAYLERLAREGWQPQRVTGFVLAGMSAVCERREQHALLAARDGNAVYLIEADASEQTIYALGAGASLE